MEILFSFLGGLVLTAIIAFFIARSVVKSRTSMAEQTARAQAESSCKVVQTRLESDLVHANQRTEELIAKLEEAKVEAQGHLQTAKEEAEATLQQTKAEAAAALQKSKDEAAKLLEDTKSELRKRNADDLAARDAAHKEAMDSLQARFDETMAKVSAQVKSDTSEMLKARQKEFSETSNLSLGQIVNPLKENIAELKKAMEDGNKEQAERNGEMRERIQNLMEHSEAARKSADELAAAFKHGSKVQGDWGETILEELLASQGVIGKFASPIFGKVNSPT